MENNKPFRLVFRAGDVHEISCVLFTLQKLFFILDYRIIHYSTHKVAAKFEVTGQNIAEWLQWSRSNEELECVCNVIHKTIVSIHEHGASHGNLSFRAMYWREDGSILLLDLPCAQVSTIDEFRILLESSKDKDIHIENQRYLNMWYLKMCALPAPLDICTLRCGSYAYKSALDFTLRDFITWHFGSQALLLLRNIPNWEWLQVRSLLSGCGQDQAWVFLLSDPQKKRYVLKLRKSEEAHKHAEAKYAILMHLQFLKLGAPELLGYAEWELRDGKQCVGHIQECVEVLADKFRASLFKTEHPTLQEWRQVKQVVLEYFSMINSYLTEMYANGLWHSDTHLHNWGLRGSQLCLFDFDYASNGVFDGLNRFKAHSTKASFFQDLVCLAHAIRRTNVHSDNFPLLVYGLRKLHCCMRKADSSIPSPPNLTILFSQAKSKKCQQECENFLKWYRLNVNRDATLAKRPKNQSLYVNRNQADWNKHVVRL
jgi:tRNA A-37 threonylcarbamoyl transferase component Bud32